MPLAPPRRSALVRAHGGDLARLIKRDHIDDLEHLAGVVVELDEYLARLPDWKRRGGGPLAGPLAGGPIGTRSATAELRGHGACRAQAGLCRGSGRVLARLGPGCSPHCSSSARRASSGLRLLSWARLRRCHRWPLPPPWRPPACTAGAQGSVRGSAHTPGELWLRRAVGSDIGEGWPRCTLAISQSRSFTSSANRASSPDWSCLFHTSKYLAASAV